MNKFKEWFASQDFYTNMRFVHGDALFDKDGDFFRILAVQIAWEGWQSRQAEVEELSSQINEMAEVGLSQESVIREKDKRIETLITTWRNQTKELCNVDDKHVREALLSCADELEALRGEHEA